MSFFDDPSQQEEEDSFFSLRSQPPVPGPSSPPPAPPPNPAYGGRDISVAPTENPLAAEEQRELLESEGNPVQRLARRWMDERNAPEILVHDPHGEMDHCLQLLLRQQDAVNDLRSDLEHWDEVEHIRLLLVQQDVERIRWLVSSIMRCRLSKIESQYQALLADENYRQRLSFEESQYLERYEVLRSNNLQSLVLDLLPRKLGGLNDQPVNTPDMDAAVYIQVLRPCEPVRLPDGSMQDLEEGSIHMVRWRTVRGLVREGRVRLV